SDSLGWPKTQYPNVRLSWGESPILSLPHHIGIINKGAPLFKALVLYIEHRFYGDSIPFGNIDEALADIEARGCLTSAQALMDFAEIIQTTKKNFLHKNSPIIVIGCSYSGMLAAWFRLKFPHITIGALASSAPNFYFDMDRKWDNEYCDVVSKDYKVILVHNENIIAYLNNLFKTCSPILSIKALNSSLMSMYWYAAQYNGRYNGEINQVCDEIVRASDNDILG
ncbi:Lysosomal Pro-X carboxypeptidase, partial [Bienertia sinuspersici]